MSGDINNNSAVIWSKTSKPAQMIVEYSTNELFRNVRRVLGGIATEKTDLTARLNLSGLPQGQQIFYRVLFQDIADNILSTSVQGTFRTAPNIKDKTSPENILRLQILPDLTPLPPFPTREGGFQSLSPLLLEVWRGVFFLFRRCL
jgi:PhoD-like phosphatase, N-terminal domain